MKIQTIEKCLSIAAALAAIVSATIMCKQLMNENQLAREVGIVNQQCARK